MALRVYSNNRGGFLLFRGTEQAGWVGDGKVVFFGFEHGDEARAAADVAYEALRLWHARQRRSGFVPESKTLLGTLVDGGPYTRLTLDGITVGRIIEPDEDLPQGGSYGFELQLPAGLPSSTEVPAARIIELALERHARMRGLARAAIGALV